MGYSSHTIGSHLVVTGQVFTWPNYAKWVRSIDEETGIVKYEWYLTGRTKQVNHKGTCTIAEFAAELDRRAEAWTAHETGEPVTIEPLTTASVERDLYEVAKLFEWSGYAIGPGSGPMFSGGDGARIPACPVCRGIHPSHGRSSFIDEALGHRADCKVGRFLASVESARAAVASI